MRYWKKVLGVAVVGVVAVCAFGVSMSVSAFALPTILPETVTKWTGKGIGTSELQKKNGNTVKCTAAKGEGTVEQPKPLGLFHIVFEGCTLTVLETKECTGLGDSAGKILSLGSWHLVYDHLGAALSEAGVAILFLLDTVHLVCQTIAGAVLITLPLGAMMLCLVANPTALSLSFEFHCEKQATGVTKESKYYNEGGTLVSIVKNESIENEKTAEESVEKVLATIGYAGSAILLMI